MTVWAKLQSWLGASASDVAIDNEFNNIYLGLNEAANGNLPSGYNKVDLTFTGASLTIKGETKIGNTNVPLDSALTVSGLAGWRYIVTTNGGVMSVESIPPAEITADTQVYTPTPVFNVVNNGYYSTVNTARRIVGICYFDATNIKEVIAYGIGKNKNDSEYASNADFSTSSNSANGRLQYVSTYKRTRGDSIVIVDGGAGVTDSEGCKITVNKSGYLALNGSIFIDNNNAVGLIEVYIYKNGVAYQYIAGGVAASTVSKTDSSNFSFPSLTVAKNDYFNFVIQSVTGSYSASLAQINASFKEF